MPTPKAKLEIWVDEAGVIQVSGPLDQKLLCYMLLEEARDVIKDRSDEAKRRKVQPATAADLHQIAGTIGGH